MKFSQKKNVPPTPKTEVLGISTNVVIDPITLSFVGSGVIILVSCGILIFLKKRKKYSMKHLIKQTKSDVETREFGKLFAKTVEDGTVLALHGDLGSGKTTFAQGLAEGFGITRHVTSPTFLIQKSYEILDGKMLYHLDLYRLQNEKEAEGIGINDLFSQKNNIVVIEWPEKIPSLLPKDTIHLYFAYVDEVTREIRREM